MDSKVIDEATSLRLVRQYDAPPERVFDALTRPELLSQWFAPGDDFDAVVDRFQTEVGGAYRIEMRHQNGDIHTCIGEIQEVKRPDRLVYTWKWEGGEMGDTLVTWELRSSGTGTELTLTHERFPNDAARDEHAKGWTGCLERLTRIL